MAVTVDVINIGTLSSNRFWEEGPAARAAHATCTLIRDDDVTILVDPSLPAELMAHRLDERAGITSDNIDVVFLTNFKPVHRRGLSLFPEAQWVMGEVELEAVLEILNQTVSGVGPVGAEVSLNELNTELELAGRFTPAADSLSDHVDFFPAYGATAGSGALLVRASRTVVVAGDAIISRDYLLNGRIWERSVEPESAKESFSEILEIADVVIPGHDNLILMG